MRWAWFDADVVRGGFDADVVKVREMREEVVAEIGGEVKNCVAGEEGE